MVYIRYKKRKKYIGGKTADPEFIFPDIFELWKSLITAAEDRR